MFNDAVKWQDAVKNAEHYLAIGEKDIHLFGETDFPWEFATEVEPGCGYRYNIPTGLSFTGVHPCGLKFRWSLELEKKGSNGASGFQIDIERLRGVAVKVSDKVRSQMETHFRETAKAVRAQADEYQAAADKQYSTANQLERIMALATA